MAEKDQENRKDVFDVDGQAETADECTEIKDRLLRLAAEFDNYKKRVAKDIDNSKDLGRADVVARLLPTVDEFELALSAFQKGDEHVKGLEMIFSNLISSLKSFGLREIEVDGKFDPYKHDIMLTKKSDKPDGEILEVVRKGYMLNNVMIRPASVIISDGETGKQEQKGE